MYIMKYQCLCLRDSVEFSEAILKSKDSGVEELEQDRL